MDFLWFIILVFLLLAVFAAWPTWPHARTRGWGYGPSAGAAALFVLLFLLFWFGLIAIWWPWAGYY